MFSAIAPRKSDSLLPRRRLTLRRLAVGAAALAAAWPAFGAGEVAVLQAEKIAPYQKALEGFRLACSERLVELDLGPQLERQEAAWAKLSASRPRLIVAFGARAAYAAGNAVKDIPIVFCLVLNPATYGIAGPNITGVKSAIAPGTQIDIFQKIMPRVKRVGLIYSDPSLEGWVAKARDYCRPNGMELSAVRIASTDQIPEAVEGLLSRVDLLWLVYDPIVTSSQKIVTEWIMLPALREKIPVAGFNKWCVTVGALFCAYADYTEMGKQAGEIANLILRGEPPASIPVESPTRIHLFMNPQVANRLQVDIPSDAYIFSGEEHEKF